MGTLVYDRLEFQAELRAELSEAERALRYALALRDESAAMDAAFSRACIRANIRRLAQCSQ